MFAKALLKTENLSEIKYSASSKILLSPDETTLSRISDDDEPPMVTPTKKRRMCGTPGCNLSDHRSCDGENEMVVIELSTVDDESEMLHLCVKACCASVNSGQARAVRAPAPDHHMHVPGTWSGAASLVLLSPWHADHASPKCLPTRYAHRMWHSAHSLFGKGH